MSGTKLFWYNRHCFSPYGKLPDIMSFTGITRSLRSTAKPEFSTYDCGYEDPPQYSYRAFFQASGDADCDLFYCHQDGRLYCPGQNELFLWCGRAPVPHEGYIEPDTRTTTSRWCVVNADFDCLAGFVPKDDIQKCISVDAYRTDEPDACGSVVAKIVKTRSGDTGVVYIDMLALDDPYAQHVIKATMSKLNEERKGIDEV